MSSASCLDECVLGAVSADQYLQTSVPSYPAWRFINQTLPPDSRVLTFSGGDQLYSQRERLWSDATAAYPMTWRAFSGQESDVLHAAQRLGISHVLFDKRQIADRHSRRFGDSQRKNENLLSHVNLAGRWIRALSPRNARIIRMGFRN